MLFIYVLSYGLSFNKIVKQRTKETKEIKKQGQDNTFQAGRKKIRSSTLENRSMKKYLLLFLILYIPIGTKDKEKKLRDKDKMCNAFQVRRKMQKFDPQVSFDSQGRRGRRRGVHETVVCHNIYALVSAT